MISEISVFSPVSFKRQRTTSTPKAGPVHGEPNKNIKRQLQYEHGKSTCAFTESETAEDSFAAEFSCLEESNSKTNDGFIIPDVVLETFEKNGQKDAVILLNGLVILISNTLC